MAQQDPVSRGRAGVCLVRKRRADREEPAGPEDAPMKQIRVEEMTPEQRRLYEGWLQSGQPNPILAAIRMTKETVRRLWSEGLDPGSIRSGVLATVSDCAHVLRADERTMFLALVDRAIQDTL